MKILAGFDLGTTGCRALLFDEALRVLGESYYEYPLLTAENGVVEQDAEDWWRLLLRALGEAAERAGVAVSEVCALSLSSQGITVVPVDARWRPLANAINWLDHRPDTGAEEFLERAGEARYRAITARLTPAPYGISKIGWFKRHRPELDARTAKYLMPMDFIIARLCGEAVTDHSMAAGMGCYDLARRAWSEDLLALAGIGADLLPRLCDSGAVAGFVTREAAALSGLRPGTPVAVGAQDQKCGALGAGLCAGTATVSMGTCLAVEIAVDRVVCDPDDYLPCFANPFSDGCMLEGCVNVGAGALKWYRDLFMPDASYSQLCQLAASHVPDMASAMFFPHLCGMSTPQRWDNCSAGFYGLTLNTDAANVAHAVLESVAMALRQNLDAARRTAGAQIDRLRVFGGGAKSEEWLQMIADVTGLPLETLHTHEMCCQGAAMLAGIAAGAFKDIGDSQRVGGEVKRRYLPREAYARVYDARYALYNRREYRIYRDAAAE